MKVKNKYYKYGVILVIFTIIVPFLIDLLILGNEFPSNVSNGEWMSFLGSYIGSLIGSATTFVGIMITLRFTRKQADYDREFAQKQAVDERNFQQMQNNEERRLSLAPLLKYYMHEKTLFDKKHDIDIFHVIDKNDNTQVNATISIKNIGMGPLLDFNIYNMTFKDESLAYTIEGKNDILEKNSEWFMLIDLRLRLDEIKNETLIKTLPGSVVEFTPPIECTKGGELFLTIGYKDLVGNKYEQNIKIFMNLGCEGSANEIGWKYSIPELWIKSIEKCRIIS